MFWMILIVRVWASEVDLSLPAERAVRSLNQIIEWQQAPRNQGRQWSRIYQWYSNDVG